MKTWIVIKGEMGILNSGYFLKENKVHKIAYASPYKCLSVVSLHTYWNYIVVTMIVCFDF
jgi:hypothetical protein